MNTIICQESRTEFFLCNKIIKGIAKTIPFNLLCNFNKLLDDCELVADKGKGLCFVVNCSNKVEYPENKFNDVANPAENGDYSADNAHEYKKKRLISLELRVG